MSLFHHGQDNTLVDNDDSVNVSGPKSTQAAGELLPPYIPFDPRQEVQPSRTLVLCFDGTGDQFDEDNSNIVQFVSMLVKGDKTKQMVYYQAGIGTYTSPFFVTPLMVKLSKLFDAMFAWNFKAHVIGGYEFLMQNYRFGDKICIFGFSRGAYTARSLAGMIHKVGIIPADNHQQVPFACEAYTRANRKGLAESNAFRRTFSVDVDIEFVGVWDTVDSIGIKPTYFPLTGGTSVVKTFRHAVSLDEHRSKFNPNLWNRLIDDDEEKYLALDGRVANINKLQDFQKIHQDGGNDIDEPTPTLRKRKPDRNEDVNLDRSNTQDDSTQDYSEMLYTGKSNTQTHVEEVWFAGCHCDIGGGSVDNDTPQSLARIPLRWMVRECFKAKTGILFDTKSLSTIGLDPTTLYPYVLERPQLSDSLIAQARERVIQTPESTWWPWIKSWFTTVPKNHPRKVPFVSEDDEDLRDALSPKYDQLEINRLWWIVEIFLVTMTYMKSNNKWISYTRFNLGKPRFIPHQRSQGVKVHRSVKLRMEAQQQDGGDQYRPIAQLIVEPTWI